MATKLKSIRQELRRRLHDSIAHTVKWLQAVVRGYFQHHAVPRNEKRPKAFRHEVLHMLASVVADDVYGILRERRVHDSDKTRAALADLPESWERQRANTPERHMNRTERRAAQRRVPRPQSRPV